MAEAQTIKKIEENNKNAIQNAIKLHLKISKNLNYSFVTLKKRK